MSVFSRQMLLTCLCHQKAFPDVLRVDLPSATLVVRFIPPSTDRKFVGYVSDRLMNLHRNIVKSAGKLWDDERIK